MTTQQFPRASRSRRAQLRAPAIIVLCLLLVIPGYALSQLAAQLDWRWVVGAVLASSCFAFFAYRSDKRSAEAGEWRVPESTLHFLAWMGGWPGAFVAQRVFRHKTSKISFQVVFWIIVPLHQLVAVDALLDWRLTKGAIRALKARMV